jgi:hypothetical protein
MGRLDEKDPRFKELADSLIAKINERDIEYSGATGLHLYQALCLTPNSFKNKL